MMHAVFAFIQEAAKEPKPGLLTPEAGLMIWTLIVFGILFFILKRFAFGPITLAVRNREIALEEAIAGAKRDREEAARILEQHRKDIDAARGEAQKLIADGRATADGVRASMLEETKKQQSELLERARRDIESERNKAIAELRREAVDLAIAAASKAIEKNLDDAQNRKLIDDYLGTVKH